MDMQHSPSHTSMIDEQPVRATTTPVRALTDRFNLVVIGILGLFAVLSICNIVRSFNLWLALLTLAVLVFLPLFIWGIITREIELNQAGIHYHEAFRHLSIAWDSLEAVKLESYKGQITLRSNGKHIRIHTIGLKADEVANVHQVLIKQLQAHHIPFSI